MNKFSQIMEAIFKIAAELLALFRISRETKKEETRIRQKEIFVKQAEKQQEATVKDSDEKLIAEVISSSGEERNKKLDEIRKIISK